MSSIMNTRAGRIGTIALAGVTLAGVAAAPALAGVGGSAQAGATSTINVPTSRAAAHQNLSMERTAKAVNREIAGQARFVEGTAYLQEPTNRNGKETVVIKVPPQTQVPTTGPVVLGAYWTVPQSIVKSTGGAPFRILGSKLEPSAKKADLLVRVKLLPNKVTPQNNPNMMSWPIVAHFLVPYNIH